MQIPPAGGRRKPGAHDGLSIFFANGEKVDESPTCRNKTTPEIMRFLLFSLSYELFMLVFSGSFSLCL